MEQQVVHILQLRAPLEPMPLSRVPVSYVLPELIQSKQGHYFVPLAPLENIQRQQKPLLLRHVYLALLRLIPLQGPPDAQVLVLQDTLYPLQERHALLVHPEHSRR